MSTNTELTGCACRWDADDKRVATCVRHQGWLEVVQEWAERAKAAEAANSILLTGSDFYRKERDALQAEAEGKRAVLAEALAALDTAQPEPVISKHSAEDNYQHFLAYSQLPHSDILRFAYYHGADADCDKPQVQEPSAYEVYGPYERQVFKDTSSAEAYRCGLNQGYGAEAYLTRPLYAVQQAQPDGINDVYLKGYAAGKQAQPERAPLIPCRCFDEVSKRLCADKTRCSRIEAHGIKQGGQHD